MFSSITYVEITSPVMTIGPSNTPRCS